MIHKLLISDPTTTVVPWWPQVERWAGVTELEFSPGLTVVWGRNGSGKSSLITLLAQLTLCLQGRVSTVTENGVRSFFGRRTDRLGRSAPLTGAEVITDGKAVRYLAPTKQLGLADGAFDFDFINDGIAAVMAKKASDGERTLRAVDALFNVPEGEQFVPKDKLKHVNDVWLEVKAAATRNLEARGPAGPPTVLLDEPDLHLGLDYQDHLWSKIIPVVSQSYQVVVATHSPFAVNVPGATYLETTPGYLDRCRANLKRALGC